MEGVWSAEDTTPAAIEAGLRELLLERYAREDALAPARVLNLVVVVDRAWRGEIENRLERVGRYHASRTILCSVDGNRRGLDAWATIDAGAESVAGRPLGHERVELELGRRHLARLDSIVDPLVVTDLATVVWAPHRHHEAVDSLLSLAQVVLLDSVEEPDLADALARTRTLSERAYVVDLAWLRSTPWRERISATFDPRARRLRLSDISAVTVRHHPSSGVAGLLLLGWLSSRLGWRPGSLVGRGETLHGRARAARQEVSLTLEPTTGQEVPGLAGITVETGSGAALSLDRGEGGLRAVQRARDGSEASWTVLGASRGEGGILGEGIRQALLRDPTYRPAVEAANAFIG